MVRVCARTIVIFSDVCTKVQECDARLYRTGWQDR